MTGRFTEKTVLITGAARGQGEAEARSFIEEGAYVVITDMLDSAGAALAAELGDRCAYHHLDVSTESDWLAARQHVEKHLGSLHVLINNAGVPYRHPIMQTSLDDWNRVIGINLTGAFLGIRTFAPLIAASGGGTIINIASMSGLTGHHTSAYSASKWALRGLTKTAALEFAKSGIRVNCVNPGLVETPFAPGDTAFPKAVIELTPLGRTGTTDDVCKAVLFLASEDASFMTGEEITVDGGLISTGIFTEIARRVNDAT